ncbi:myosin light chain kinase [Pelomyxa schiedti]|nr:myosin light chain kinase [Pelomyxa schiedti]
MGCCGSHESGSSDAAASHPPSKGTASSSSGASSTGTTPTASSSTGAKPADSKAGTAEAIFPEIVNKGTVEEHFNILEELGRGGFAVVRRATSKANGEAVAIKFIEKKFVVDPNERKCLVREIEIMKRVNHPNVLHLIDIFETDTHLCMVMELITGGELFYKIVNRGSYGEKDAIGIVRQLVTGVEYLHREGVAHRDLKPENLLCNGDGESMVIKIADFGLSKMFSNDVLQTSCGTPDYAAPEVLQMEGTYGMEVDMWSVGVITYVLLCGYPPFYAEDHGELFRLILAARYDFPEDDWKHVSNEAKDFIRHLLVVDPKERLTAAQCLQHPWLNKGADLGSSSLAVTSALGDYTKKRKAAAGGGN